ncbi:aromatic acid exporter family protein [Cytobacillus praedii]|uniref:Aromatic acid exporter family protein n=1 Tax=Cytobacillus praedii TaxID=1742358 RepID=A0A4R1AQI3_9BACI|nr:aromatic acid exporter family protein [Cytobacillus praedii]MED3551116.1 aromatic acid exporter family protein [Cytobacillus praedii]MED3571723.1 aromatic acid exporter family protein [Cytobacillus praedii]TCJ02203.1 aromatic acid exporter family protein [Cytobacillus praedii]
MKFKIGYRTIKTAIGTSAAIILAQILGFDNFVSAGILTILCIQVTKKKSIKTSWNRFSACLLAMLFSIVFFEGMAYHPIIIGFLLLFFIPTAVMLKISDGIVTSSVIILHIYSAGEVTFDILMNELGIITIGIGVALLANLYMPSLDQKLLEYQIQIEENFKRIFDEIVIYLRTNESNWDGLEITETAQLIEEAQVLAYRDVENRLLRNENVYYHYFKMREKQFEIIERVLPIVISISYTIEQGEMVADFMEELAANIHPGNTANRFLEKLYEMKSSFKSMELPKTREEFEARAALFQFVREMEEYLWIKSSAKELKRGRKENHFTESGAN